MQLIRLYKGRRKKLGSESGLIEYQTLQLGELWGEEQGKMKRLMKVFFNGWSILEGWRIERFLKVCGFHRFREGI